VYGGRGHEIRGREGLKKLRLSRIIDLSALPTKNKKQKKNYVDIISQDLVTLSFLFKYMLSLCRLAE
jgi:hypothetical protein